MLTLHEYLTCYFIADGTKRFGVMIEWFFRAISVCFPSGVFTIVLFLITVSLLSDVFVRNAQVKYF